MSGTNPQTNVSQMMAQAELVSTNYLSFQGFTSGTQALSLQRGPGYTVVHTSTGIYTVTLSFPPAVSVSGTASNNVGLTLEPSGYVVSETAATLPASVFVIQCTRVASDGTFTVQAKVAGSLADVTTADRVFVSYAWRSTGYSA